RLGPELFAHLLDLAGDLLPLLLFRTDELVERLALGAQLLVLPLDLDFLELAQIAQPHVEDGVRLHIGEPERLHQDRLGLILVADDSDNLIKVEISDEVAAQHLKAMFDLAEAESRAPEQHFTAMAKPFCKYLRQTDDLGDASLHQDVHVERNAAFEFAELEQRLHQQPGVDCTRARLDHQPDVACRFIANIGDERQLFLGDELGELFHQPTLLHQPGNLGDDDEVSPATRVFLMPAGPYPERPTTGGVGLRDRGGRIDDDAPRRENGARHGFQEWSAPPACRV